MIEMCTLTQLYTKTKRLSMNMDNTKRNFENIISVNENNSTVD